MRFGEFPMRRDQQPCGGIYITLITLITLPTLPILYSRGILLLNCRPLLSRRGVVEFFVVCGLFAAVTLLSGRLLNRVRAGQQTNRYR